MKKDNVYKAIVFHDGRVIILSGQFANEYDDKYTGACYNSDGSVGLADNSLSLKIIASNYLPKLPNINFNHVNLGVPDIESLATDHAFYCPAVLTETESDMLSNGFYSGYERCLKDMAHRKFTETDMANFGQYCIRQFALFRNHDNDFAQRILPEYIQDVFKPKVFDLEIDFQVDMILQNCGTIDWIPRLENNCVKLLKATPCTEFQPK